MPPLSIQKKFPLVCLLDIVLLSLSLTPALSPSCVSLTSSFFFTLFNWLLPLSSSFLFHPLFLSFFLLPTPALSLLHPSPSLSRLNTTAHRLDELMMCLDLPQLHIHHNIYHIIIYLLRCFTYSRISKSSPGFAFSVCFCVFLCCLWQLCHLIGKKCADLLHCQTHGQSPASAK